MLNTILSGLTPPDKDAVWRKGWVIPNLDSAMWRRDDYGRTMKYTDWGNRSSQFGWEIDHIVAKALGGSDDISNLRPLQCKVNAALGGLLGAMLNK